MKKLMISMLAMVAMVSCSTEDVVENNDPVEIKLKAGVIETKAVETTASLAKAWFANGAETIAYSAIPWAATLANGVITFDPKQYYPTTAATPVFLKGYAPEGIYTEGVIAYTITGDEDIIVTQEQFGSKSAPLGEANPFEFQHKLTQLQFTVVASAEAGNSWGTLTSIELTEQPTALDLTLATDVLVEATAPKKGTLSVKGYTGMPGISVTPNTSGYIMILPGQTSIPLTVKTTGGGVSTLNVALSGAVKTEEGKAHKITLTFNATDIELKSAVTDWAKGAEGTGELK